MDRFAMPVVFALFVWWFGTGVTLLANHLPRRTHRAGFALSSVAAVAGLGGLWATRDMVGARGAYEAFAASVAVWAWHETSFFMGFVTGPDPSPCPPGCVGWARFRRAVRACLHHEIAILASVALVAAATWGGANQVGFWTFVVLFAMRQSAKLNMHLGVRNLGLELIPPHLIFVRGYMTRARMNALFPVSIAAATAASTWLIARAGAAAEPVGVTLIATMLIVGLIEHVLLMTPLPAASSWGWMRGIWTAPMVAPALARKGER